MDKQGIFDINITDISSTMLLTLYCHSQESQSRNPILADLKAVEITNALNPQLATSYDRMSRDLAAGKLNKKLVIFIALRAKKFDDYAKDFLKAHPDGTVVNLGCGLDTRFWRIDNGHVNFYDLDLPEVIDIKKRLCSEGGRYHMIGSSVLDFAWMDLLKRSSAGPFLFLAEGLFMYLEKERVKDLVLKMQSEFRGSELVCEIVNESVTHGWLNRLMNMRMHNQLHVGGGATFICGFKDGNEIEAWAPGIKLLDEWSHFDSNEKKLSWVRIYGKIPSMKRVQWTVRYKLGGVEQ
jgi:methyltransferase (TIGR00027 family)